MFLEYNGKRFKVPHAEFGQNDHREDVTTIKKVRRYLNFTKVDLKNADLELSDECYKIVELLKNISHHNQAAKFRIAEDWTTWSNLVDDLISISNDKYELCRQLMSFVSFALAIKRIA